MKLQECSSTGQATGLCSAAKLKALLVSAKLSVSAMSFFELSEKGWEKDVGFAPTLNVSSFSIPFSGELLFQSHSLAMLPRAGKH